MGYMKTWKVTNFCFSDVDRFFMYIFLSNGRKEIFTFQRQCHRILTSSFFIKLLLLVLLEDQCADFFPRRTFTEIFGESELPGT